MLRDTPMTRSRQFSSSVARRVVAVGGVVIFGSSCDLILGINGDYSVGTTNGSGASGGSGGDASSSSTSNNGGTGGAIMPIDDCAPLYAGPIDPVGSPGEGCPAGMVRILEGEVIDPADMAAKHVDTFCIQPREVTFEEYTSIADIGERCFDDEHPSVRCAGNDRFSTLGAASFHVDADAKLPVHPVDFCDADTYCRARGLRTCETYEWWFACGGGNALPFANPSDHACVTTADDLRAHDGSNTCNGDAAPQTLLFDMIGNVSELTACNDGEGCATWGTRIGVGQIDHETVEGPPFPPDDPSSCFLLTRAPMRDVMDPSRPIDDPALEDDAIPLPDYARVGFRCCYTPDG